MQSFLTITICLFYPYAFSLQENKIKKANNASKQAL